MAKQELKPTQPSVLDSICKCIDRRKSFILEAGAGSGKTRTLVDALRHIVAKRGLELAQASQRVACITFTNVAKAEIEDRLSKSPLVRVSTIHEFLWSVVGTYQKELRESIIEYNDTHPKSKVEGLKELIANQQISYSQYGRSFENGWISHNDVIALSHAIFQKYDKACWLLASLYPIVLVDEYQDTDPMIVDILTKRVLPLLERRFVVGFFGDSMQKIYPDGVGAIENDTNLTRLTKLENYRCSVAVVRLLNKIRPALIQIPSGSNLTGSVTFINTHGHISNNENYLQELKTKVISHHGWNEAGTKILFLTHKKIAGQLGYKNLLEAYEELSFGRDRLFQQDDPFSAFIFGRLEPTIRAFTQNRYGEFFGLLGKDLQFESHSDKARMSDQFSELSRLMRTSVVEEVLNYAFDNALFSRPVAIREFDQSLISDEGEEVESKKAFYNKLVTLNYIEFTRAYDFIQESTPFSTKHGVKGAEFENVIVVIDDSAWSQFKFEEVFSGDRKRPERYDRTLNLLYVCCSRAKNNLMLVSLSPFGAAAMDGVRRLFGKENIFEVGDYL